MSDTVKVKAWCVIDRNGLPLWVSFWRRKAVGMAENNETHGWKHLREKEGYRVIKCYVEIPNPYKPKETT